MAHTSQPHPRKPRRDRSGPASTHAADEPRIISMSEVAISELHEHPDNPRRIEPGRLAALKASMQKDRAMLQVRPVIALLDGTVIMGNQRLRAAREMHAAGVIGWDTIPTILVDLDQETAHAWMLRDNNSYGEWDPALLSDLIKTAKVADKAKLTELGFRHVDIRRILPQGADAPQQPALEPVYHVRIDCQDEADQLETLGSLSEAGYDVHPLLAYAPRKRVTQPAPPIPNRKADVELTTAIVRTPRVMQVEGLFDLTPEKQDRFVIRSALPLSEQPWNVGLIVGPSGSGKTTIARALFPHGDPDIQWAEMMPWSPDHSIVDSFPADMSISDLGELLSSVGFSSPRSWLHPYFALSTGEQFRVDMARAIAQAKELTVVDEFTSVVDRTVARTASHAIARAARSRGQRFVAVTCHEDVVDWLQPDWVYRPATDDFAWRSVQRHPPIALHIRRCDPSFWPLFRRYHYLSPTLLAGADCFVGFWDERPVAFTAYTPVYGHPLHKLESRVVCLPDYQGVGIGTRMADYTAGILTALGFTVHSVASHPARVAYNAASPYWLLRHQPTLQRQQDPRNIASMGRLGTRASGRITTSFEYVGPRLTRIRAQEVMAQVVHLNEDGTYSIGENRNGTEATRHQDRGLGRRAGRAGSGGATPTGVGADPERELPSGA